MVTAWRGKGRGVLLVVLVASRPHGGRGTEGEARPRWKAACRCLRSEGLGIPREESGSGGMTAPDSLRCEQWNR